MAARAVASTTIAFGLVSIPIKLYTAASADQVHFNMISKKTGSRIKMQYVDAATGEVVERDDTLKGYEYAKGQYVTFTEEELKALESDRKGVIEISEFLPAGAVDTVQVEKSYYLGPDKGGDRAYRLLGGVMRELGRVAIGRWSTRGRDQLVLIRPFGTGKHAGLALAQLYYGTEVRSFEEVDTAATFEFADVERELARRLVEQLSTPAFVADRYKDGYVERVRRAVEQKVAGQEVTVAPDAPRAQIIDLFEALKRSLAATPTATPAVAAAPEVAAAAAAPTPLVAEAAEPALVAKPVKKATPRARKAKTGTHE